MHGAFALGRKSPGPIEPGQRGKPYVPTRGDVAHGFNEASTSVYVMMADAAAVKIGVSNSPGGRARNIQTGQEKNITVYWAVRLRRPEANFVEKTIHKELGKTAHHSRGEWYYIDPHTAVCLIQALIRKHGFKSVPDITFGTERGFD